MIKGNVLAVNTGYRLLNIAVVFFINILLSRLAGVEGYGLLSLLIANAGIFNLLSAFGADAGLTYHAAASRLSASRLFFLFMAIVLFQLIALVISELFCWYVFGHFLLFKTDNLQYWWLGPLFLLCISLVEKYSALLQGQQQFVRCSKAILFSNGLVLLFFAALFGMDAGRPVEHYIGVYVLLSLVQALFLGISYHRIAKSNRQIEKPARQEIRVFFSYSMLAFLINVIQFLAYRVDYWLVDYYRGGEELGWYSLAVRLCQLFWVIPVLFAGIIFPAVAGNRSGYDEYKMQALLRGMNLFNVCAAITAFVLIPLLIPFLFGNAYRPSVVLFQVLLPGVIVFCVATILAAFFAGQKKLRINLFASLLCLTVILVLDMILIPLQGMEGAALASSIGYGVTAIYYMVVYCYTARISPIKLFIPEKNDWNYIRSLFQFKKAKEN